MSNPLINYFELYSDLNSGLNNLQKEKIVYKKHGNRIIFKSNIENTDEDLHLYTNGIILDINSKPKVICSSVCRGKTYETFKKSVKFKDIIVEENIEGTLINLYYYNKKWNVSTRFCLDAENSIYKSNKSFRRHFDELININSLKLDTNFTYSFILQTINNRLVSPIFENKLYHLETTSNITGERIYIDLGIEHPKILHLNNFNNMFSSYPDIEVYINNLSWQNKGCIIYSKNREIHTEIINPKYKYVHNKIENQSNKKYICLRSLYYNNDFEEMIHYFPEYRPIYLEVIDDFMHLVNNLYFLYLHTKCFKKNITIPFVFQKIIRKIHRYYLNIKETNYRYKINQNDIMNVLFTQECKYLYTLIYSKDHF